MDEYQIMSLLMRLETRDADPQTVAAMYAETLSDASERLTDDQMRRFLICGAFLCHGANRNAGGATSMDGADPAGRSNIQLN